MPVFFLWEAQPRQGKRSSALGGKVHQSDNDRHLTDQVLTDQVLQFGIDRKLTGVLLLA